jgi:hypothetical protein
MHIPRSKLERFAADIIGQCTTSRADRINRGELFKAYASTGADNPQDAAIFNKTYAYLDDLESLLYSPVSLRFHIGDPDIPNILNDAKGRAAAARLRSFARKTQTDTTVSEAVYWSLVKGKSCIKQLFKGDAFSPKLIQPESLGVMYENHTALDEDMEAFVHTMLITPYQFQRMIAEHPDRRELEKKAKNYMRGDNAHRLGEAGAQKQVIVGGLYPFQPAGSGSPNNTRGIVAWMGNQSPVMSQAQVSSMMEMHELWVWDDKRNDWATMQMIGEDMLISGKYRTFNAFAEDKAALESTPALKGKHPFTEFCANRTDGYFWGRSEIVNVALLQEAINRRINGVNRLLRQQEQPATKFIGGTGVNQASLAKFNKPGGYWVDGNPNAKVERDNIQIPQDLWASLHEYERMFDEMGGLPPIARGHGEAGVRSHNHAETLVRMFSPRFKDRALLVERDVEALGALMLDMCRAHVPKKMVAWVAEDAAGAEAPADKNPLLTPPAPGMVPVWFSFADLDDDSSLTIDSHSSSPAFSQEARALTFDLFKIGAMSAEEVVERSDVSDPEELTAGIQRRAIAKEAAMKEQERLKLLSHGGKK